MHNPHAYSDKQRATRKARELQRDADPGMLFGVEYDRHKEPYGFRVVSFDLNDPVDRWAIAPVGTYRVRGVEVVMFARRLTLIVPTPRPAPPVRGRRRRAREAVAA